MPVKASPLRNRLFICCTGLWVKLVKRHAGFLSNLVLSAVCSLLVHNLILHIVSLGLDMAKHVQKWQFLNVSIIACLKPTEMYTETKAHWGTLQFLTFSTWRTRLLNQFRQREKAGWWSFTFLHNHSALCQRNFCNLPVFSQILEIV